MNCVSPFEPEKEFKVYNSCKCSQIIHSIRAGHVPTFLKSFEIVLLLQAFNCFYDVWFERNRAQNFKNRAFFLHFLEIWLNLIFSKNVIYAFRPSRKTLKVIKNIKRSWRIRFQLLKRQNRPPNDEKKTKFPNKMSEILDFTETVSRYRRYLAHFSIFFKSVFCIAFYTF